MGGPLLHGGREERRGGREIERTRALARESVYRCVECGQCFSVLEHPTSLCQKDLPPDWKTIVLEEICVYSVKTRKQF